MSLSELRASLGAFWRDCGEEELTAVGQAPTLVPSPALDARHADLFRTQSLDAAADLASERVARRWKRFVMAGIGRRASTEARQGLADLLQRWRDTPPSLGPVRADLEEHAAALASDCRELAATATQRLQPPADSDCRQSGAALAARLLHDASLIEELSSGPARGEHGDVLPAGGTRDLWRGLVASGRYLRRGDGRVEWQTGPQAVTVPLEVPARVVQVDPGGGGVTAYQEALEAAGEALAWSHLPERLDAEARYLPEEFGASVHGGLFARRLSEMAWLEARGIHGSRADLVAGAARVARARRLVALAREAMAGEPDSFRAAWIRRLGWNLAAGRKVARVAGTRPASVALEAERLAALLNEILRTRFGRRWDESPRAAAMLRDLWSCGWSRPTVELISSLGGTDPDGEVVLEELRQAAAARPA